MSKEVGTLPVVGMGCTEVLGSDNYACTITWVSPSFKEFRYTHDECNMIEGSGMSEHQVYEYTTVPGAHESTAKLSRCALDKGTNRYHNHGTPVIVDYRRAYRDPSF
jgi:hypothetical protein